ncbi:MAG: hypothetical protein ACXADH_16240, partial [Candidatus Kariarchaeaceae archaeon]
LLFCGEVEIIVFRETKIEFRYDEKLYNLFYVRPMNKWMITQKNDFGANLRRLREKRAKKS